MPREQDRVVGNLGQLLREALIQRKWIAARKISAAATLEEERVAGNQSAIEHEALASRGMTRRVDQFDWDIADHHHIAAAMRNEIGVGQIGDLAHVFGFFGLHMDRHGNDVE